MKNETHMNNIKKFILFSLISFILKWLFGFESIVIVLLCTILCDITNIINYNKK